LAVTEQGEPSRNNTNTNTNTNMGKGKQEDSCCYRVCCFPCYCLGGAVDVLCDFFKLVLCCPCRCICGCPELAAERS